MDAKDSAAISAEFLGGLVEVTYHGVDGEADGYGLLLSRDSGGFNVLTDIGELRGVSGVSFTLGVVR